MMAICRSKLVQGGAFLAVLALAYAGTPGVSASAQGTGEQGANFQAFIQSFRFQALAEGITADVYDRAMMGLAPNERVVRALNTQPEFVRPIWEYIEGAVSQRRIDGGREQIAVNADRCTTGDDADAITQTHTDRQYACTRISAN